MDYKPLDLPLKEYEGRIRRREFWDDLASEWCNKPSEQKLIILAGFVQKGGSLKKAINKYAKDRDEIYRERILHSILSHILKIFSNNGIDKCYYADVFKNRIKRYDKDELVSLLSYLLKTCVMEKDFWVNYDRKKSWVVEYTNKLTPDELLDRFDKKFFRSHPEVSFMTFLHRADVWWNPHYSLW